MDETMFMAFATEVDDYNKRVKDCVKAITEGCTDSEAINWYDVDPEDVYDAMRYMI